MPALQDAPYFLMEVNFHPLDLPDSNYHFRLHHGAYKKEYAPFDVTPSTLSPALSSILHNMQCGDHIQLILPFSHFDNTYLCAYADQTNFDTTTAMLLDLHLVRTFDETNWMRYLTRAAQQKEIEEVDAIALHLINQDRFPFEQKGKCFIQYFEQTQGDSIHTGDMLRMEYTSYLLDGTSLDSTTTLQFDFGRPGQLIGGLNYAVSQLREGEFARVFLPSFLAFGEQGSSTGIVPARTPMYFDVKILSVDTTSFPQ
jgi:FKBP-type peptidyl-prolyl cis-trans isomerase